MWRFIERLQSGAIKSPRWFCGVNIWIWAGPSAVRWSCRQGDCRSNAAAIDFPFIVLDTSFYGLIFLMFWAVQSVHSLLFSFSSVLSIAFSLLYEHLDHSAESNQALFLDALLCKITKQSTSCNPMKTERSRETIIHIKQSEQSHRSLWKWCINQK